MVFFRFLLLMLFFAFVTVVAFAIAIGALSLIMTGDVMILFTRLKKRLWDERMRGLKQSQDIWKEDTTLNKKKGAK